MAFVTLKDVYKRYHVGEVTINAADGMTFDIEKGELCVIVGPSGSGKTTVLNMLGGMDTATSGTIVLDGNQSRRRERRIHLSGIPAINHLDVIRSRKILFEPNIQLVLDLLRTAQAGNIDIGVDRLQLTAGNRAESQTEHQYEI